MSTIKLLTLAEAADLLSLPAEDIAALVESGKLRMAARTRRNIWLRAEDVELLRDMVVAS